MASLAFFAPSSSRAATHGAWAEFTYGEHLWDSENKPLDYSGANLVLMAAAPRLLAEYEGLIEFIKTWATPGHEFVNRLEAFLAEVKHGIR